MSSLRRPSKVRAQSPDQPRAKGNRKSKEQRDTSDRQPPVCANSKSDEKPASKRQSNKQRDLSNRDRESESQESKSEEQRAISRRTHKSAHNNVESIREAQASKNDTRETGDTNRQSKKQNDPQNCESEDKPQKTTKSKCDKNPAPKRASNNRQSKKQRDPSSRGTDYESPEGSKSKSEEKYVAESPRTHRTVPNNAHRTDEAQISQNDRQVAPPAVCAGKFEGKEKSAQNPGALDTDAGQTRAAEISTMRMRSVEDNIGKVLRATIEKLKIKTSERSKASSCVNDITDAVIAHLKQNMSWCEYIECLRSGSYYENLKICEPDEFDVMLTIPVERVDIQNFSDNGAFYSVALKRSPNKHPLNKFLNEDKTIRASEMLSEFRDAVKDALERLSYKIVVERKKARCPAVTLQVTENGKTISIDFVLGLKVHSSSWPPFTKDGFKVENWLGTKEKADLKRQPFYLVPKYEGKGNAEHDGVVAKDAWRISFSHVEKDILKRHGHSKTCCEARGQKCCRKECLKLLKYLLGQLKKKHPKEMSNFCSYHAKTTLLHACAERVEDSEWASNQLADCFHQLLEDFIEHLRKRDLPNFFVPSHNLIHPSYLNKSSCDFLAQQIEIQRNNNFPIFC
ncbi:cyclic GMP-AMP synthase-like [Myxocyprinus asiaticus]|uniref:cyclic GMP-AMP synthase-like n=1 Tax=Myxocyprinus asiaticus TaxID=70543 RepID=UPI002223D851|nr:cyclic GMP-AMP synthase-like [Myxocyprinus asiaticus]